MNDSLADGTRTAMRHIPPVDYLIYKVDDEYRWRVQKLLRCFDQMRDRLNPEELEHLKGHFLALARSLERIPEVLRPSRSNHAAEDFRSRLETAFAHAAQALLSASPEALRTRAPDMQFEKSPGEFLFGAFLILSHRMRGLTEAVAALAPEVWEVLLGDLVQMQHPVNEETLQPIA